MSKEKLSKEELLKLGSKIEPMLIVEEMSHLAALRHTINNDLLTAEQMQGCTKVELLKEIDKVTISGLATMSKFLPEYAKDFNVGINKSMSAIIEGIKDEA